MEFWGLMELYLNYFKGISLERWANCEETSRWCRWYIVREKDNS